MSDKHKCTRGGVGAGLPVGPGVKVVGAVEHGHGISCREISEFLLAYLEHELEGEARAEFERHLNGCPPCGHYLASYRETVELVRRCVREGSGSGAKHEPPEGLIQAILAAKRSTDPGSEC